MADARTELLQASPNGVVVNVLASAGASVSKIRGIHGGALKVAVRAAPENGKANAEIEEVLAKFFDVGKKSAVVVQGMTSRNKRVEIAGVDMAAAQKLIDALE